MAFIIKNTSALINTLITDAARKRISQGKFDISYFQIGDSEVCYNCVNNFDPVNFNVLMPQFNAQNTAPIPEKNRMHIKYPLFLDSTSGSTFGVPFDNSYIDNIYNSAAPRGFFTGDTTLGFSAFTSTAYTINPNFVVDNTTLSGNVITLSATTLYPSVSGTVSNGMFMVLFVNNTFEPISTNSPTFIYSVVSVTGDSSTATTINIEVDRSLPNYSLMGYSGYSSVMFLPSSMTELYDTFTPQPYWATDVFNFETNCDISQRNVNVWNMNIPWTESPAGLFASTYQDYNLFQSKNYTNTKEYLGYNNVNGQEDTGEVFYFNSFGEKIVVTPTDQKAIAIVHYTNQAIDNFYGEKFAFQDYDPVNPNGTGQARNFKISIPWLLWHKNPSGTTGVDFYVDPPGFSNLNLFNPYYIESKRDISFNNPGLRYYHLWDTFTNSNGIPSRVGKVFPDLKIIVFDDDEIVAALNYKSNRSWTLPAPKLGLITPNTFGGVLGGTVGLLSGNTETLFMTYALNSSAFTNSLHCNYYSTISGNDQSLLPGASDIIMRFGNEFPFLQSDLLTTPSGFTANEIKLIVQKVPSGTTRPNPTLWKEIDITNQFTASTQNGYLTVSGLTGTTIQLTKNMYDTASLYNLSSYINLPVLNQSGVTLNFGGEYLFFGTITTDIQATIYVMNFLVNLGQTQFFDSSNPTWDKTKSIYVTEVALYNADKELMVISKIQSPEKRQGVQQYPIKLDF
jgi:hypothetical protein